MNELEYYSLGIDIGSTTVKIAILDKNNDVVFLITKDIMQIFRKLWLLFLKKLKTN